MLFKFLKKFFTKEITKGSNIKVDGIVMKIKDITLRPAFGYNVIVFKCENTDEKNYIELLPHKHVTINSTIQVGMEIYDVSVNTLKNGYTVQINDEWPEYSEKGKNKK